ncbi:Na+/H+ antiporter [Actinopolymorpha alba]|uniref:Na+/H+ antiporter n=1 Tax=Actinopolymorpha alba TaxID=533267 RepID=UPI0003651165|nr:Na+/H+ antiporter [Actinopolymorpha alba]
MSATLLDGVLLLAIVGAVSGLARRVGLLAPILLVMVGIIMSYLPFVPAFHLEPELVLGGILPLLLYAAAIQTSVPAFRRNLRPIGLLAFGHVLFITLVVGLAVHALVPGIPLAAAFALGAIVSPPDAVAATSIARRIGLPRKTVTILEGESLVNDATALVTLRVAVAATVGAALSWDAALRELAIAAIGGVLIGWVVGWLAAWLHRRTDDALIDNTVSILTPFLAFVPAERFGASGVVAVVVCGMYVGHRRPLLMGPASRLQMDAFWRVTQFLLEGFVFLLVGLQMRGIVDRLSYAWPMVLVVSAAVVGVVVVGRFVWVFPGVYLPRLLPRVRAREPQPSPANVAVVSWAGMRGVVSLAAAFSLPFTFPGRDLLVWVTFVVILVTLVGQGFTLPWFARWLRVSRDDPQADALAEAEVRQAAFRAAQRRLEEEAAKVGAPSYVVERLNALAENRANEAWERLGNPDREPPSEAFRRLRLAMLEAERQEFIDARDRGILPDEVRNRVELEQDLEEMMLSRRRRRDDE